MAEISLTEAKRHVRAEDFTDDDAYIAALIEAAEAYIEQIGGADISPFALPVRHAVLMLVGYWYENREAATASPPAPIAFGVNALLSPFMEQTL